MSYLPNIEISKHDMSELLSKLRSMSDIEPSEPKCTCNELSKQRALCPVCDKDKYDRLKVIAWQEKQPKSNR